MALFLTGGGDQENFEEIDQSFSSMLGPEARVLVIPFSNEDKDYFMVKQRVEECFPELNITLCKSPEQLVFDKIKDFDALFFEGGNTFKLITEIRAFMNDIKKFYEQEGKHIYADSAGAIVLGSHVKSAFLGEEADEDENRIQDYRGVGLIDHWSVHCHFESGDAADLEDLKYETGSPTLALSEECSILIDDGQISVLGSVEARIFSFSETASVAPGESGNLSEI